MARVFAVRVGVVLAIRVSWYKWLEGCEIVMVFRTCLGGKARFGFVMDSRFVLVAGCGFAKTVTSNLPLLSVLGGALLLILSSECKFSG